MSVIEVEGLVKRFGQFTAVGGISFQVEQGEIFGLLGPNGAGKTTTIRCLLTLIPPTAGTAKIAGFDVFKHQQQVREVSGYVPQDVSVDGDLTGYENLLFYAKLFRIPGVVRKERIKDVIRFMELTDKANELARNYSGGMMRRLEIAQVLINRPRILFLDEPSIGLDPAAKRVVWDYINRLRNEFGATILLTTHDMNEADQLCDHIAIMNGGKIAVTGSPSELKAGLGGDIITIVSSDSNCRQVLEQLGYRLMPRSQDSACDLVVDDGERKIPEIIDKLRSHGIGTLSVSLKVGTLDDVFLKYAGKRIGEGDLTFRTTRAVRRTARRHG
ncbi:MAG: ATP-binding cassette domain-containing protein [Dehalococcoidales bacterium]|nr:ATP-binding cassette domain-containing protein [Dehalococcoidales bacterium]